MSESRNTMTNKDDEKKFLKMSDEVIALVRELVQLSILTGTNIVDHLRAIQLSSTDDGFVYPTEQYINSYNAQIEELTKKAEEMQAKMQAQEAVDSENAN